MKRDLIPNTTSQIQLCGELAGGLQGAADPNFTDPNFLE